MLRARPHPTCRTISLCFAHAALLSASARNGTIGLTHSASRLQPATLAWIHGLPARKGWIHFGRRQASSAACAWRDRGQEGAGRSPGCCPTGQRLGALQPVPLRFLLRSLLRIRARHPPLQPVPLLSAVPPDDGHGGSPGERLLDRDALLRRVPGGRGGAGAAAPVPSPCPRPLAYLALALTIGGHCMVVAEDRLNLGGDPGPGDLFSSIGFAVDIFVFATGDILSLRALLVGGEELD